MAPGTDGLTSYICKHCFHIVSDVVTEMVKEIFDGGSPTYSQRLSRVVFGYKPKNLGSLNPKDKRRISLLNCDFKIISGIECLRLKKTATWSLLRYHLVAGENRRIHHRINLARDTIIAVEDVRNKGCRIVETDY